MLVLKKSHNSATFGRPGALPSVIRSCRQRRMSSAVMTKIDAGASNLSSTVSPKLADPYRMLQSTGLFPPLSRALDLAQNVELTPSALRLATGTLDFAIPNDVQLLMDRSAWQDALDYAGAQLHIDSTRNWHVDLDGLRLEYYEPHERAWLISDDSGNLRDACRRVAALAPQVTAQLREAGELDPPVTGYDERVQQGPWW